MTNDIWDLPCYILHMTPWIRHFMYVLRPTQGSQMSYVLNLRSLTKTTSKKALWLDDVISSLVLNVLQNEKHRYFPTVLRSMIVIRNSQTNISYQWKNLSKAFFITFYTSLHNKYISEVEKYKLAICHQRRQQLCGYQSSAKTNVHRTITLSSPRSSTEWETGALHDWRTSITGCPNYSHRTKKNYFRLIFRL